MSRKNIFGFIVTLALAIGIILPTSSYAQSTKKRIDIIEKQLKALQRRVFKPGSKFSQKEISSDPVVTGGSVQQADIEARLAQMETQLRQLTGRIEESNYQNGKIKQQLETMARDYEFRLAELEKNKVVDVDAVRAKVKELREAHPQGAVVIQSFLPDGTVQQQYSYAQKLVTKGQYAEAENALTEFLKRYPEDKLAGNAQYWLGQTYYIRKIYTKAARTFLDGYNNYPKSPKSPAFLLKIGMSFNAMGEKNEACDSYRELASRFPDSLESKNKRPPLEKKAGCN